MSVKYPKDHARKGCTCGGHSAKDRKKSRTHHATRVRIERRKARRAALDAGRA